eukprot:TRINITY_DN1405_c0_g1_i1.p1 TRINITY_DN1405_c0_g1~~TRINITY_DN1405_c0_g1_i1.p1  ORF type:complete len:509 (+),score=198.16 TRINITY_DN1405_c0_g1_i1:122-1648(+)
MDDFEFLLQDFESNESSSNTSSPTNNNNNNDFNMGELLLPMDNLNYNNNGMLMSSNFFDIKTETNLSNNNLMFTPNTNQEIMNNTINNTNNEIEIESLVNENNKKKRGRPKKVTTQNNNKENVPKKRGRPKVKKEVSYEEETIIEDSDEKSNKSEEKVTKFKGKSPHFLTEIPPVGSAFDLRRDKLLEVSSQEYEKYYENIKKHRALTEEEESRFKRDNRLIRNRESAQKSRNKKKMHVDKLEKKINDLESTITKLKNQNLNQMNEINSLKDRNLYLENLLKKAELNDQTPKFDMKNGLFIFLIIFSFGIFFNFSSQKSSMGLQSITNGAPHQNFHHSRGLLSVDSHNNNNNDQKISSAPARPLSLPPAKSNDSTKNQRTKISVADSSPVLSKNSHYFNRKENNNKLVNNNYNDKELVISPHDALVKQHSRADLDDLSDDASYIYCSEAKRVSKGDTKAPVVGFLIPSDFLNDTNLIPQNKNERPPLVEIICSQIEVIPIYPLSSSER